MAELIFISGLFFILGIGGFVADYIFPHIKPLARYIDSLSILEDGFEDEEIADKLRMEELF